MEIWKKIEGFENYEVSNYGNVKSLSRKTNFGCGYKTYPEKILKNWIDKKGYHYVDLRNNKVRKRFLVHRLVAFSFLDNIENKPQINHIDGIKSNNFLHNLEWCTSKENIRHAVDLGLNKNNGINHYQSKLSKKDVVFIRNSNLTQQKLSEKFKTSQSIISKVINNKSYKNV